MLSINYQLLEFAKVTNLQNFYKSNLQEIPKVRSLMESIKLQFSLPSSNLELYVSEGSRVYKIVLLEPGVKKYPFGYFIYLPLERRLDLYLAENTSIPYIQWKNKKIVFKTYPYFLERAGINEIFRKFVNIL